MRARMKFLHGQALNEAVRTLLREPKARCAVAFWGNGAEKWLRKDARIICNLATGGTNPHVVKAIPKGSRKQHDSLHAKVYIGQGRAIVASANASANGLGFEGGEASQWLETGVEVLEIGEIAEWFEGLWGESRDIEDEDIKRALELWKNRQKFKPSLATPKEWIFSRRDMPLISWMGNEAYSVLEANVRKQLGYYSKDVARKIDRGIEIEGDEDRKALSEGRWVLCWEPGRDGQFKTRKKPYWIYLGQTIENAFKYKGFKAQAVAMENDYRPPVPFDVTTEEFRRELGEVINQPKYNDLRPSDYEGAFFTPARLRLMEKAWKDIIERYQ